MLVLFTVCALAYAGATSFLALLGALLPLAGWFFLGILGAYGYMMAQIFSHR